MLVLKLQQASNEIMKLKQEKASSSRAPSSGTTATTSSSSTGFTSTSGGNGDRPLTLSQSNKFVLALAESEHRRECEVRELQQRMDFQQLTQSMSHHQQLQRMSAVEAELKITKEKLNQAKDKNRALQQQCDSAEVRFADLEATATKRISQMETELRAANEAKDAALRDVDEMEDEAVSKLELA